MRLHVRILTCQVKEQRTKQTFRSPEILAPARIPVADGKKIENMPKKLPSFPRQSGTKLVAKMSANERKKEIVILSYTEYMLIESFCDII